MPRSWETVLQGVGLLAVYSLGLGLPFLAAAVGINYLLAFTPRFRRAAEITGGVLPVAVGLLVVFDRMTWLSQHLSFLRRFAL